MTPAARVQAAVELLDEIRDGAPAGRALVAWGRRARYAGSGDRAAVRDLVYDALRRWRSYAALGGSETGRGLMIGRLRATGTPPDRLFDGGRHAPAPLTDAERASGRAPRDAEAVDLPDWLWAAFRRNFGAGAAGIALALRERAPVHLRVNLGAASRADAAEALASEGIRTRPGRAAGTALEVIEDARRVAGSAAYRAGVVELQDAASQAVVEALPLSPGTRALDFCAGGGGKALAMAARTGGEVCVHDADPRRMADLPARAVRAGAQLRTLDTPETAGPFDLVLCDVPCSGSGAWRRDPAGKWRLAPADLAALTREQDAILDRASALVAPRGMLAYATCSVLAEENAARIEAFRARHPGWTCRRERQWLPGDDGDGFFLAMLTRNDAKVRSTPGRGLLSAV